MTTTIGNYWVLTPKADRPKYYRTLTAARLAADKAAKQDGEAEYGIVRPDTFNHVRLGLITA